MILDIESTIVTQSILWFSLNHLIDEISCFNWPASLNFSLFNLNLFWQYVISDLLSWFSNVWSSAVHAFVSHNSNSEIVNWGGMILPTHNFRSHVTWSTRCVLSILWPPYSSNTEISYSQISFGVYHKVFRLDISMDDLFLMTVFQSCHQTCNKEAYIHEYSN